MRPTFFYPTHLSAGEAFERVRVAVAAHADDMCGQFTDRHAMISIVDSNRHFWSPWLHLEIRESENGNELFGRFSPHPSIWTGFMFAYLSLALVAFFSSIVGISQWLAAEHLWGISLIPVCGLVAIVLWMASQAGQKLAWNEMAKMQQMVADCLNE